MIKTVIGLIFLLMPFLLIIRFDDKRKGFFYVLSFLIFFHLLSGIVTQFFGIFNYWIVIFINLILSVVILIKTDYKKLIKNAKTLKIDWVLIFAIIILLIELFSVHYNYSGKIATINGVEEVRNMRYAYPYYSDEWSAVSFIKYSIEYGKLPFANPLWHNSYFPNLEFAFHSFLSGLFLLLDLNPLINYGLFALFFGILICIIVYFVLRLNNADKLPSAIAVLSIPYIVNSSNLPGIWYLIPLSLGIICLLLSFVFISIKDTKMLLFTSFLTLIFYPPLFVLSFASLIFYILFFDIKRKEKIKYIGIYLLICFIASLIISFKLILASFEDFSFFDASKINILKEKEIWKKSWLMGPILIGLSYWMVYSFVFWRFIIEYQRAVVATSVLIVIFSGFGINHAVNYIKKKGFVNDKVLNSVFVSILIIFLFFSFFYTQRDNWNDLKLYSNGNKIGDPAPPANNYLIEDDLRLFKNIKNSSFIAPAWKGLVIGTATRNYPLESKQSTITNAILKYNDFINSDCNSKIRLAKEYRIDYVYSSQFNCSGFNLIDKSKEGLFLYEVKV